MSQLQKVLWTKGVLLHPQHLQAQDRYLENLLRFRLDALAFCPWGFRRLVVDRDALAAGSIALTAASGLFPDGLVFDIGGGDAAPAPLSLAEHWRPDQAELDVYLAIPEQRAGRQSIATRPGERDTRYVAEMLVLRDDNTGLAEKPIQVARRNLRLLAEGETLEGNSVLPVARVRRSAGGQLELAADFIPPLVDIGASPAVLGMLRRLVELLVARSTALSGMRRQRNAGLAEFGISDVPNFWLLYTVNSHLPRFRHLLDAGAGHPAVLYGAMAELAGALMTFAPTGQPSDLPPYDHQDLTRVIRSLDTLLRELLEAAVPARYVSLPLRRTETSVYATALDQDRYFAAPQMYLAVSSGSGPAELMRRVPQLLKVSSADRIEGLIRRALPGVSLRHVPDPPSAVPIRLDYEYFALERSGEDWESIQRSRHLAAYVPAELPEAELELVIVLP